MNSGSWKFFVIHFIYFSSVETDINFLLTCIFLAWELVVYYLGGGGGGGIFMWDHYKNLHWFGGFIFR